MLGVLLFLIIFHTYFSKMDYFFMVFVLDFLFSIHFFDFFYNFIGGGCENTLQMLSRYFFIYECGLYYIIVVNTYFIWVFLLIMVVIIK